MELMIDTLVSGLGTEVKQLATQLFFMGMLFLSDYAGRISGNLLRSRVNNKLTRFLVFVAVAILMFMVSNIVWKATNPPNIYQKYGLNRMASSSQTRELYRKLARESHPDLRGKTGDFHTLNEELKVLTNEKTRWMYERFGRQARDSDDNSESSQQITAAMTSFFSYLGWVAMVLIAVQDEPTMNSKMSVFTFTLGCYLFEVYNILARRPGTTDPLDFIYYDLTIGERGALIRSWLPMFIFLLTMYKFSLQTPWIMGFRNLSKGAIGCLMFLRGTDAKNHNAWHDQESLVRAQFNVLTEGQRVIVDNNNGRREVNQDEAAGNEQERVADPRVPVGEGETVKQGGRGREDVRDPRDARLLPLVWSLAKTLGAIFLVTQTVNYLLRS